MGKTNLKRMLLGALAAGLLMWVIECAAATLYIDQMTAAMRAHNLSMDESPAIIATSLAVSLIAGFTIMFFYTACRPRLGPGPKTAVTVASILWFGGYLLSLIGVRMMGLFSNSLIAMWGAIGLVEMNLAALLGAYI